MGQTTHHNLPFKTKICFIVVNIPLIITLLPAYWLYAGYYFQLFNIILVIKMSGEIGCEPVNATISKGSVRTRE